MKKKAETATYYIGSYAIPVTIHYENRRNVRASIGKTGAFLRMPVQLRQNAVERYKEWFKNWLEIQSKEPRQLARFKVKTYQTGDKIEVLNKCYLLNITYETRKTHRAKLEGQTIFLKLSPDDSLENLQKSIKQLLSRTIGQDCMPYIESRVDFYNDTYFKEDIRDIRMKYNQSNWGSCSSKHNLNFSTRLLFAPLEVIDYVIVHELAHLKELNHSSRFWKIVSDVMPDYRKKEIWLEKNGHLCHF